jgi:hypothetical protein
LDGLGLDLPACTKLLEARGRKFRSVVKAKGRRLSAPLDQLSQLGYNTQGAAGAIYGDVEHFAVKVIHNMEQPKGRAADQPIVHEVQRPRLIGPAGLHKRLYWTRNAPLAGARPLVQLHLAVDAPNTHVVPGLALFAQIVVRLAKAVSDRAIQDGANRIDNLAVIAAAVLPYSNLMFCVALSSQC